MRWRCEQIQTPDIHVTRGLDVGEPRAQGDGGKPGGIVANRQDLDLVRSSQGSLPQSSIIRLRTEDDPTFISRPGYVECEAVLPLQLRLCAVFQPQQPKGRTG